MSATFRIIEDTGGIGVERLVKRFLPSAGPESVLVGVPASAGPAAGGISLAEVALWNEFGTARIPERPFLRRLGERRLTQQFVRLNANNMLAMASGLMTRETALNQLGALAAGKVKEEISAGNFTENAPSTIAKKGSDKPLIDSGQLRQSITWEINRGQGGPAL